ncbi:MAG: S1 RNA-binding domain-containing protein [Clostridia bacterium]|nr:S1 RNA-binding domain-containing protein [Clostridia bacterium]
MSYTVGESVNGVVSGVTSYGAFVRLENGETGMVHISKLSADFVSDIHSVIKLGDSVTAKVISNQNGKIALSMLPDTPPAPKCADFESMLSAYKAVSEANLAGINSRNKKKRR